MMKGKLRIAFDELIREKNSGSNILLEGIGLLLIGVIIFFQALNNYNEIEINKILKYGVKYTGMAVANSYNTLEDLEKFKSEIKNIKGIQQIGFYGEGLFDRDDFKGNVFDEIYEIQKVHRDILWDRSEGEEQWGKVMESVNLIEGSEKLLNLEVSKGYEFDKCNSLLNDYDEVIYLGSKINKLKIGTVIYDRYNRKAIIGGYLEPDLRMVKDEISDGTAAYMDMNYKVLRVFKNEFPDWGDVVFGISSDSDMNKIKDEICLLAKTHNVDMTVKTYEGIFDNTAGRKSVLISLLERILFVVLLTVIIFQICIQSKHIIENFRNYGIMYANGFSTSDHFCIFIVQSIIKGIIAISLALGAGYLLIAAFYSDGIYSIDVLYEVIFNYVLWRVFLCAVVIAIFSAIVSITVFLGKTPKELIQES